MMYYKVIKDDKVIDVLDHLKYFKWQSENKIMLLTDINDAQTILSSDGNTMWHVENLYRLPDDAPKFDVVELIKIDKYEYEQLRILNMKSPEAIIDEYNLLLLKMEII